MIALILAGAHFLTLAMGFTGLPRHVAEFIGSLQLSPLMLIFALTIFYIVLGCFLDGISSVVLTMAVVEPMIRQAGIDIVWFAVIGLISGTAHYFIVSAYRRAPAAVVAPFEYIAIAWAAAFGFVFWQEVPDLPTMAGIALIFAGGLVILYGDRGSRRGART